MGELLEEAAQEWGDREAVVSSHQGIRKTFSQVGMKNLVWETLSLSCRICVKWCVEFG